LDIKKPKRMADPKLEGITDESERIKVIKRLRERDRRERLRQEGMSKSPSTVDVEERRAVTAKQNTVRHLWAILTGSRERY
jgi:hypothetical protein